jgi:hypothetical protein
MQYVFLVTVSDGVRALSEVSDSAVERFIRLTPIRIQYLCYIKILAYYWPSTKSAVCYGEIELFCFTGQERDINCSLLLLCYRSGNGG